MLKKILQAIITRCGGTWIGKFLSKDDLIDYALKNNLDKELSKKAKNKELTQSQVTKVITISEGEVAQEVLRHYQLDDKQQEILCNRKNTLLIETYLSPVGYLDPERRFCPKAEFIYTETMINKTSTIGIEMFKTYVDNNKKNILTLELLKVSLQKIFTSPNDCVAAKYLLQKAFFTEEEEVYLLENSNYEMVEEYILNKQIYQETAQLLLVEKFFELAKLHQEEYGLRLKALQAFHAKRKEELQSLHPEGSVP